MVERPDATDSTVRRRFALPRLVFLLLGGFAVTDGIVVAQVSSGFEATANFISSITAITNTITLVCFSVGAWYAWKGLPDSRGWAIFRAATTNYLVTMSILFLVIYGPGALKDPYQLNFDSVVLHLIIPIYGVIDWLLYPGGTRTPYRNIWILGIFPVVWFIYTFIRGSITGLYVYDFLNPAMVGGLQRVVLMTILVLSCFFLSGVGALATNSERRRLNALSRGLA